MVISSCSIELDSPEIDCDYASLCIKNPSSEYVIPYSWGSSSSSYFDDTLWPGDCALLEATNVTKGGGNSENVSFKTIGGITNYKWDQCRQQYDAEIGFVDLKADCDNGEFNPESGELDTDCGGWCDPCGKFNLNCILPNEAIEFPNSTYLNENLSGGYFSQHLDNIEVTFYFLNSIGTAYFDIFKMPKQSRKFIIGPQLNQVRFVYNTGQFRQEYYSANYEQEMYLTKLGPKKWILEFCNIEFDFNGTIEYVNASLPFNED